MSGRPPRPRNPIGCQEVYPGSDYTDEEREFLQAMDRYKRTRCRPYPTWHEVLQVLQALGWRKVAEPRELPRAPSVPGWMMSDNAMSAEVNDARARGGK